MALIAFLIDLEEGHLLPSFSLAHSLKKFGHEILYISVLDNEQQIKEQGFEFVAILEEIYPLGFNRRLKEFVKMQGLHSAKVDRHHVGVISNALVELIFKGINPRLFIVSSFLHIEALVLHYKFNIDPVMFTPFIREINSSVYNDCVNEIMDMSGARAMKLLELMGEFGIDAKSLTELAGPLNGFCELVACSGAISLGDRSAENNFHYIGPSVFRVTDPDTRTSIRGIVGNKQIIFASMGSQVTSYGEVGRLLLHKLINIMRLEEMSGMHLVLSIGPERETAEFEPVPAGVTLMKWVCQPEILKVAALAITHGGLGTVKECIYYGVPMVVIPVCRDQPANARRVEGCNLGVQLNLDDVTEPRLVYTIKSIFSNENIRDSVKKMQEVFRKEEADNLGAHIIERLLRVREREKINL